MLLFLRRNRKMTKFRMFFNTDRETKWLNRMAEQGWAMTGFSFGFYRFEKCEPGEYIYQVDAAEKMFSVSKDYRQFMEEMGVEIVGIWGCWIFLRRKAEEGPFQLYTDVESSYEYYTKARNAFLTASIIEGACLFNLVINGVFLAAAWGLVLLVAVILAVFLGEMMRLNGILAELKNRLEPGQRGTASAAAPRMRVVCMRAGGIIICLCCAPLLHSFLHELGHCIAVWICGGTVTGFYPFGPDAHMTYEGLPGTLSYALVDVAGTMLPLMIAAAVLLFYRGSKKHSLLNILLLILSAEFLTPVIIWIEEPLFYLLNFADSGDDVIHFLDRTEVHPAAVALCATLILVPMIFLFAKRMLGMFHNFRRSTVRKCIILFTSIVIVTYAFYVPSTCDPVRGNFQYTAEGRQDSILQEEFNIDISRAGDYVFYAEWEVDREGAIAAVILKDEDKIYAGTSAMYITLESAPFYLESGSYTLSFYFLNSEEDWLEYCRSIGAEAGGMEDFLWQPEGRSTVTGSYGLRQER